MGLAGLESVCEVAYGSEFEGFGDVAGGGEALDFGSGKAEADGVGVDAEFH